MDDKNESWYRGGGKTAQHTRDESNLAFAVLIDRGELNATERMGDNIGHCVVEDGGKEEKGG